MKTLQCSFFSAPKILDTCKKSDFHPILHFQGEKQVQCMHIYRGITPWLSICGLREGIENSQIKSWSYQALDWNGPEDTSVTSTLSCRPLIYLEKEEAAESSTFIAGSIFTPAASTNQTTD